ncbi:MAG: TolC family protein [Planctomycetota bacterium]
MISALLLCLLVSLPAQTAPSPSEAPWQLSLDEAIAQARSHNLALRTAALDAAAAVASFQAAWGPFDTIFFANGSASRGTTAPSGANFVGGTFVGAGPKVKADVVSLTSGFSGQFLTGTTWVFDVNLSGVETDVGGGFIREVYRGNWNLDLTQPLLRGSGDYARDALLLARHDASISALQAEQTANQTLMDVTRAYWNLVFALRDVITREASVTLATELLEITRRKFEQGLQNRINVTEVEAELATRRQELLTAVTGRQAAEDELRRLVLAPERDEDWNRPIEPTTEPGGVVVVTPDLDTALAVARRSRADLEAARRGVERSDVEVRRAESQSEPRLDVTGGYGLNSNESSYGHAAKHLDDIGFKEAHVRFAFELPLGNRAAEFALRRAQVLRERSGVSLREAELLTVSEVRAAVREVQLQSERVVATAEATRLQREVYEGETRRLENDLSTPFQVRQTQRDLFTAIDNETRARLDLEVARSNLLAAQGVLLSVHGSERLLPELSLSEAP